MLQLRVCAAWRIPARAQGETDVQAQCRTGQFQLWYFDCGKGTTGRTVDAGERLQRVILARSNAELRREWSRRTPWLPDGRADGDITCRIMIRVRQRSETEKTTP